MATHPFGSKRFSVKRAERVDDGVRTGPSILDVTGPIAGDERESDSANHSEQPSDGGNGGTVDPASLTGDSSSDTGHGFFPDGRPRKRRPRGSGPRTATSGSTSRKSASETSGDLTRILFSMHLMGAAFLKTPQLALDETEAKNLGDAVSRVTELYDIPLMDEKSRAWLNLGMVAAGVYGPRIASVAIDRKKAKGKDVIVERVNTGVYQMPGAM